MKIVVVIQQCVQIGPDDFGMRRTAKQFDSSASIDQLLSWARQHGKDFNLEDLQITELEIIEDDAR